MFCPKCGVKNPDEATFCKECGARIVQEEIVIPQIDQMPQPSQPPVIRKPLTIKHKIIMGEILVLLALVAGFYWVGNSISNPEQLMEKYVKTQLDGKWDDLYSFHQVKESAFINKDQFIQAMEAKASTSPDISNYKVIMNPFDDEGTGIKKKVSVQYVTQDGEDEYEDFTLILQKEKAFFFFDKWMVSDSSFAVSDFTINAGKEMVVQVDGVTLDDRYMTTNKDVSDGVIYKIPAIVEGSHQITASDVNKLYETVDESVTISRDESVYDVSSNYSQETLENASKAAADAIEKLYQAAYKNNGYESVKKYFTPNAQKQLPNLYEDIVAQYSYYSTGNYQIYKHNIEITDASSNNFYLATALEVYVTGRANITYGYYDDYWKKDMKYTTFNIIYQYATMKYENNKWMIDNIN